MNWELVKDCIDIKKPFQSKGNKGGEGSKAIYHLELPLNKSVNVLKYDADCVKVKLNHKDRIGDTFFRIKNNEKISEEKLILVETKGKQNDYFEQLSKSFDLFIEKGFEGVIHGRFVGYNVPSAVNFKKVYGNKLDIVQKKFGQKKGTIRFGNREMWEEIKNINKSELKTQNSKAKGENINL